MTVRSWPQDLLQEDPWQKYGEMPVYKQLWTVERTFRTVKSLLRTQPIYLRLDETTRGQVACSFLALVLNQELEHRLAAAHNSARASWPGVTADLDSLTEPRVEQGCARCADAARVREVWATGAEQRRLDSGSKIPPPQ